MNLYHLRYFVTLAHLEHYTKAADKLSITQPSLSHAMSLLEKELGVQLFEKDGRNVVLTKYGRIFLGYVEKSLATLDSGVDTLQKIGRGEGKIRLAFLRTLGINFVPGITKSFLESNSDRSIDFNFHTGLTSDIIQGLKNEKYDIAFCSKIDDEPKIDFIPVAAQELVLIVPKGHPLAARKTVNLTETIPYPQIFFTHTSGLRPIIDGLFKQIGQKPEIKYEVEEDQVIAGLVSQNLGIAITPNMPILNSLNVNILKIAYPSFQRLFYLAVMKNIYLTPAVRNFRNFVIAQSAHKKLDII